MKSKTAVLLLNVGTPDNYTTPAVRKYLSEFLNDPRVIDLPWLLRKILVNLIIVPFRAPKSAKLYQKIWTEKGSPLLYHGISLQNKLQEKLGKDFIVKLAMNYGQPNVSKIIDEVLGQHAEKVILFPLFPQYASSTTGSVLEKVYRLLASHNTNPSIFSISQYYNSEFYIGAIAESVKKYNLNEFDHILFSFHGLPLKQVYQSHNGRVCENFKCTTEVNANSQFCYHATCYATSRLLAEKLKISEERYTVCFQSRFGKNWLSPFTDNTLRNLAKQGKKRIIVISPSFTADCLETIVEIGIDYKKLFTDCGGDELILVESLNDSDEWSEAIVRMINGPIYHPLSSRQEG